MQQLQNDVRDCRWAKRFLVFGQTSIHDYPARSPGARDINREIRGAIDSFHQLQHRHAFNDYGKGSRDATFDDAIDLVVKMEEVIPRGDQEQIGLDQCDIKVPRKIPPERGLANATAAVDCHNHTGQPSHDRRQCLYNLQVRGQDVCQESA